MRFDPHLEEQVAGRPTPSARHPLTADPHSGAVGDPLGNRDADRLLAGVAFEPDVGFAAIDGEPEGDIDMGRDVFARFLDRLPPGSRLSGSTAAPEQITEPAASAAEQTLEIDLSSSERSRAAAPWKWPPAATPSALRPRAPCADPLEGAAVAVVHLALAQVVERVERRLDLLELLLRGVVIGMEIGVVLPRQFPVGLADILGRCRPRHPERLVMIVSHQAPPLSSSSVWPRPVEMGAKRASQRPILRRRHESLQGRGAGRRSERLTSVQDAWGDAPCQSTPPLHRPPGPHR